MFRFVCWGAVSSDEQKDNTSIPSQIEVAREAGARLGGVEVLIAWDETGEPKPFIADGYSRTAYYNLDDAVQDIPALKAMLDNMAQYDVIICKNYDRYGSLGMPLYYYLSRFHKQLHAVQQATPIYEPSTYNPNKDSSVPMMIAMAAAPQIYRIQKITDNFVSGNTARAKDGKYSIRVPMGYLRTDDKEAIIDPVTSELIAQIPVWYLGGSTVAEIQRKCEASGVNPGRGQWSHKRIIDLLVNPFYAGRTFYDLDKNGQLYEGKHEPLWTYETHECILAEMERRRSRPRQKRNAYNFTSLLTCSECGKHLQIGYDSKRTKYKYWSCAGHVTISTRKADKLVADEMRRIYANAERTPVAQDGVKDFSQQKIKQVRFELKRLEEAYFHGAYNPQDYTKLKLKLESDLNKYQDEQRQKRDHERKAANRQRAELTMQQILPHIDRWLSDDDPKMVNYTLSTILTFTVHPDRRIVAERLGNG
jgi:hypothetical protein